MYSFLDVLDKWKCCKDWLCYNFFLRQPDQDFRGCILPIYCAYIVHFIETVWIILEVYQWLFLCGYFQGCEFSSMWKGNLWWHAWMSLLPIAMLDYFDMFCISDIKSTAKMFSSKDEHNYQEKWRIIFIHHFTTTQLPHCNLYHYDTCSDLEKSILLLSSIRTNLLHMQRTHTSFK